MGLKRRLHHCIVQIQQIRGFKYEKDSIMLLQTKGPFFSSHKGLYNSGYKYSL